jgi:hypothetical protein
MSFIFGFLAMVNLCAIAYQDFTSRAVSWVLFPILAAINMGLHTTSSGSFQIVCKDAGWNMIFLGVQFLITFLYFFIKNHFKWVSISDKIGLGDILFLVAVSFLFPMIQFVIFYMSSLLFSLGIYSGIISKRKSGTRGTIPLAGLQSVFLTILILCFVLGFSYMLNDELNLVNN